MYSDYQQTGTTSQPAPIPKRLPQSRKFSLYMSPLLSLSEAYLASGQKQADHMCMELQCCETRQLISPNENRKKITTNFFSKQFLSTGHGGCAALSSLLLELLFPASPPAK